MTEKTAIYKPVCCYQCGETMRSYTFKDVYKMRIDGKIHRVPVLAVPCTRCDACDIAVTSSDSDEAIMWSYNQYIKEHRLDTPWLLFRRWVRRQWLRQYDRWNYWVFKTFYKQERTHGDAA
jgi:hypothetical protein